ncbi:hypothetical protein EV356DRAFT_131086 [Viridothelium virens]|uniref:Uncharacterized protein n=1 Tax=Viridothelium virens TaxID=1048519 RepID=A0A6A6HAP8_VIRVR|nr:hypothetical protein EV356DRAFT_131086 [Viridothelium virens]
MTTMTSDTVMKAEENFCCFHPSTLHWMIEFWFSARGRAALVPSNLACLPSSRMNPAVRSSQTLPPTPFLPSSQANQDPTPPETFVRLAQLRFPPILPPFPYRLCNTGAQHRPSSENDSEYGISSNRICLWSTLKASFICSWMCRSEAEREL